MILQETITAATEALQSEAMQYDEVMTLMAALAAEGVEYVLVGGVAINFHGLPRATGDVDLFVKADPENLERLKDALRKLFDDEAVNEITIEDLAGDYPTIRYAPPAGDWFIDILSKLGDAISWDDMEWEERKIDGVPVRLATPATLWKMKHDTIRTQDRADAERLRDRFGVGE